MGNGEGVEGGVWKHGWRDSGASGQRSSSGQDSGQWTVAGKALYFGPALAAPGHTRRNEKRTDGELRSVEKFFSFYSFSFGRHFTIILPSQSLPRGGYRRAWPAGLWALGFKASRSSKLSLSLSPAVCVCVCVCVFVYVYHIGQSAVLIDARTIPHIHPYFQVRWLSQYYIPTGPSPTHASVE